ncbi:hypothetical protein B0O99DRAFT_642591 [Bisporella sp. PMI_857]|jgi:hypothetical protein|nr:hypothetical protein B0O99DRAFT_642591 [Bisporella sp. PMI_857]
MLFVILAHIPQQFNKLTPSRTACFTPTDNLPAHSVAADLRERVVDLTMKLGRHLVALG